MLFKRRYLNLLQIAGFNGLSEAVRRLDFSSAVRDVRRFNYICALLELLVGGQRLTHLPGAAQKLLLSMLEQLADQGGSHKLLFHVCLNVDPKHEAIKLSNNIDYHKRY